MIHTFLFPSMTYMLDGYGLRSNMLCLLTKEKKKKDKKWCKNEIFLGLSPTAIKGNDVTLPQQRDYSTLKLCFTFKISKFFTSYHDSRRRRYI